MTVSVDMQTLLRPPILTDDAIKTLIAQLPTLARAGFTTLNLSESQQTFTATADSKPLIVKRYIGARRWPSRLRPLWSTRAWTSSLSSKRLIEVGVRVPRFLLLVADDEDIYSVSERINAIELFVVLRDEKIFESHRSKLGTGINELMATLHAARVTHGDLHPRNILVDENGSLWLIDLDHIRFHRIGCAYRRRRIREETRLGKSLEVRPTLRADAGFTAHGDSWRWRGLPNLAIRPKGGHASRQNAEDV